MTFNNKGESNKNPSVEVKQVVEDHKLIQACDTFHSLMASGDFKGLCDAKASEASSSQDIDTWKLMRVICFEANAREELQKYLGFDSDEIMKLAIASVPSLAAQNAKQRMAVPQSLHLVPRHYLIRIPIPPPNAPPPFGW